VTLPLPLRNRLAELVLDAFDDIEARRTLEAVAAFCRSPDSRGDAEAAARLPALGWFELDGRTGVRLLGAYRAHRGVLCRRAEAAAAIFRARHDVPEGGTLRGLLARAALLAERGLFFEVHELLEPRWMRAEGAERVALQGLIQVAVAFHHAENGNRDGAVSLLTEGLAKLGAAGASLPLDTQGWQARLAECLGALREGRSVPEPPLWPIPEPLLIP